MVRDYQRPPQLGDWTVCQDKVTTKTAIRTNSIDSINQLNALDWAIADFKNGKETPYIYVPNRVYPMDTVILKPTLEGLMPIPENLDGMCRFPDGASRIQIIEAKSGVFTCDAVRCIRMQMGKRCDKYSYTEDHGGPSCKYYSDGTVESLGVSVYGIRTHIDFEIHADSAVEYLDIRITDWPRQYTNVGGGSFREYDVMGWPAGTVPPGETFRYDSLGNNIFRIWFTPGRDGINWGHAGMTKTIRVEFTLLGDQINTVDPYIFHPSFPGAQRNVTVSYVGAGRRGNHR